jgi:hypothetical protein
MVRYREKFFLMDTYVCPYCGTAVARIPSGLSVLSAQSGEESYKNLKPVLVPDPDHKYVCEGQKMITVEIIETPSGSEDEKVRFCFLGIIFDIGIWTIASEVNIGSLRTANQENILKKTIDIGDLVVSAYPFTQAFLQGPSRDFWLERVKPVIPEVESDSMLVEEQCPKMFIFTKGCFAITKSFFQKPKKRF